MLDLKNAFNLICIKEGDEWKAAFRMDKGLFEPTILQEHHLYLKGSKCFFEEISYLGLIVGNGTVKMDPVKLEAVQE